MVNNLLRLLFFMGCLSILKITDGQTNTVAKNSYSQVSIASPTAASLGKYADIPVNYHTGIPQISIPIYTVQTGPLSMPISLSYHASGLKVQEPASWVGAGWALNAGGVITRTVVGAPDEKGTNNASTETNGHFSDYGFNNYINNAGQQDWQAFANGTKDGEPDLYFFNFNGNSGKFYFNDDRKPVIVPDQDIKIVPNYTGTGSIQSFVITTPDGNHYYFGKTNATNDVDPIEITNPVTTQNGSSTGTAISSWFLNKMTSADEQFAINLSYAAENYGYFTIATFAVDGIATGPDAYGYNLVKNVMQGVRLSAVTFNNGSVTFNAGDVRTDLSDNAATMTDVTNTQAKSLANIVISNGTFSKQFNFTYAYFLDNTSPLNGTGITTMNYNLQTDKYRLRLESVQEKSTDNTANVPPYQFTYFSEKVPRRLTFGVDHWGFYNGVTSNETFIPTLTVIGTNNTQILTGANRDASWPALRGGTLQKITYPTGGFSSFDFESNAVYTTYENYESNFVTNLYVHVYGQSNLTATSTYTLSGNGDCQIIINNTSTNYEPTFRIKNSSNVDVYVINFIPVSTTSTNTINLPPGTYTATLSYPSNASNLIKSRAHR